MAMNITNNSHFPIELGQIGVFLNKEEFETFKEFYIGIAIIISFIGLITNGLNIKTFLLIGKEDGVTVSLLSLSLSDFGFCLSGLVSMLSLMFMRIETSYEILFPMDPWVISMFAYNISHAFYAITTLTTTFLAVARCMCVARPLQFSNTFTKSRAIIIHTCFAVISIGGYIPVFSEMGARRTVNAVNNQTRYVFWMSDMREDVKDVVFLIFDTILTCTSQTVLIFCLFIMSNSLRQSGQFRQSTKAKESRGNASSEEQRYKLSGKELQVIQQVLLISVMCVVCSLPKIFSAIYSLIEPEFDLTKRFHNFYFAIAAIRKTLEFFNSASTFFIYYKYNSRFREAMLGKRSSDILE